MIADRYQLDRVIGKGGMGIVYAGTHTWTERPVAVKILRAQFSHGDALKRFFREARTAAAIRHPNVVDVLDMGEDDDGAAFMVLELLEGESLQARLDRETCVDPAATLATVLPLLEPLAMAHIKGIIHRDIKPANIFMARGHGGAVIPKLLDFGVAKFAEADLRTVTGSVLGTPGYCSPEQLKGERELLPASDVFGIGVVLYRMLAGRLPHPPEINLPSWVIKIVTEAAPDLRELDPSLPAATSAVVMDTLTISTEHRVPDMPTLLTRLLAAADEDGVEAVDPRSSLPPGVL